METADKAAAEHTSSAHDAPSAMSPQRNSVPAGFTPQDERAEPTVFAPIYLSKPLQEATDNGDLALVEAALQKAWLAEAMGARTGARPATQPDLPRDWTAGCALYGPRSAASRARAILQAAGARLAPEVDSLTADCAAITLGLDVAVARGAEALCIVSPSDAFVARATAGEQFIFAKAVNPAYSALLERIRRSPLAAVFVTLTHAPLLPGAGAAVNRFSDPLESRACFAADHGQELIGPQRLTFATDRPFPPPSLGNVSAMYRAASEIPRPSLIPCVLLRIPEQKVSDARAALADAYIVEGTSAASTGVGQKRSCCAAAALFAPAPVIPGQASPLVALRYSRIKAGNSNTAEPSRGLLGAVLALDSAVNTPACRNVILRLDCRRTANLLLGLGPSPKELGLNSAALASLKQCATLANRLDFVFLSLGAPGSLPSASRLAQLGLSPGHQALKEASAFLPLPPGSTQGPEIDITALPSPVPFLSDPPAIGKCLEPFCPATAPDARRIKTPSPETMRRVRDYMGSALEQGAGIPAKPRQTAQNVNAAASKTPCDHRGNPVRILRSNVHPGLPAPSPEGLYGGVSAIHTPKSGTAREAFKSAAAPYAAALVPAIAKLREKGEDNELIARVIEFLLMASALIGGIPSQRGGGSPGQKTSRAAKEAAQVNRNATQIRAAQHGNVDAVAALLTRLSITPDQLDAPAVSPPSTSGEPQVAPHVAPPPAPPIDRGRPRAPPQRHQAPTCRQRHAESLPAWEMHSSKRRSRRQLRPWRSPT